MFIPPDMSHIPLEVIYQDEHIVAVNKPSGLLSTPAKNPQITDCVTARILSMFKNSSGPLSAHRLDMETSGVMVLGLHAKAHRDLSIQFQDRLVKKTYVAWVDGHPEQNQGTIDLPIRLDIDNRPYQIVDFEHGKKALTHWELIERRNNNSKILFKPQTGRTHQLRIHAAKGLNTPILGDRLYGIESSASRLMLHAWTLRIEHPITLQPLHFEAPIPFDNETSISHTPV